MNKLNKLRSKTKTNRKSQSKMKIQLTNLQFELEFENEKKKKAKMKFPILDFFVSLKIIWQFIFLLFLICFAFGN